MWLPTLNACACCVGWVTDPGVTVVACTCANAPGDAVATWELFGITKLPGLTVMLVTPWVCAGISSAVIV
jgi:hypothetical protein